MNPQNAGFEPAAYADSATSTEVPSGLKNRRKDKMFGVSIKAFRMEMCPDGLVQEKGFEPIRLTQQLLKLPCLPIPSLLH